MYLRHSNFTGFCTQAISSAASIFMISMLTYHWAFKFIPPSFYMGRERVKSEQRNNALYNCRAHEINSEKGNKVSINKYLFNFNRLSFKFQSRFSSESCRRTEIVMRFTSSFVCLKGNSQLYQYHWRITQKKFAAETFDPNMKGRNSKEITKFPNLKLFAFNSFHCCGNSIDSSACETILKDFFFVALASSDLSSSVWG